MALIHASESCLLNSDAIGLFHCFPIDFKGFKYIKTSLNSSEVKKKNLTTIASHLVCYSLSAKI